MVIIEFIISVIGFFMQQLPLIIELIIVYIAGKWLFNYFQRLFKTKQG